LAKLDSPVLYLVDSFCLCTFSISGAQAAIIRGLPPLVCAACGVKALEALAPLEACSSTATCACDES
jgi:hypothetical protein